MALSIESLTPLFGATITGLSIRDGVGKAEFRALCEALDTYSVLVLPDQPVTDDEQVAFSERLGPLELTLEGAVGSGTKVVRVSNILPDGTLKDPDGQKALFTRANTFWHSDSSFKKLPAYASLLSAREVASTGGDTEFASTRAAYEALDPDSQSQVAELVCVHDIAYSRRQLSPRAVTDAQRQAMPPVEQALVRTNPKNGRKALLIGSHVSGIVGMDPSAAEQLLAGLLEHATQPQFTYRHRWTVGDLVIWDNRSVLHRGHHYDEANDRRVMIRTTLAGHAPTAADGRVLAGAAS